MADEVIISLELKVILESKSIATTYVLGHQLSLSVQLYRTSLKAKEKKK